MVAATHTIAENMHPASCQSWFGYARLLNLVAICVVCIAGLFAAVRAYDGVHDLVSLGFSIAVLVLSVLAYVPAFLSAVRSPADTSHLALSCRFSGAADSPYGWSSCLSSVLRSRGCSSCSASGRTSRRLVSPLWPSASVSTTSERRDVQS
jgi:hypothetical protein